MTTDCNGQEPNPDKLDAIDAALSERRGWEPLDDADKDAIRALIAGFPELSEADRARFSKLCRGLD